MIPRTRTSAPSLIARGTPKTGLTRMSRIPVTTGPTSLEAWPGTTTWPPTTATRTTGTTRRTQFQPRRRAPWGTSRTTPERSPSTVPSSLARSGTTTSRSTPRFTGCTRLSISVSVTLKNPSLLTSTRQTTTQIRPPSRARVGHTRSPIAPRLRARVPRTPPTTR